MSDAFISMKLNTDCYHCKKVADQIIHAVPYQAQVVCDNCGVVRVFIPRIEDVTDPGAYIKIDCYDAWNLAHTADCRNCHVTGPHDIFIGCRNFTIRCRNCGFTHFYRFDLEYMAKDEPII